MHARAYGAIFSKYRFFGTTHGDKPTSQNGILLRSPSLIMAPVDTEFSIVSHNTLMKFFSFSYFMCFDDKTTLFVLDILRFSQFFARVSLDIACE